MEKANDRSVARNKPATLADVARRAGVSAMTVSRVVNGDPVVKAATRERVRAAIADLKYMSSQAARRAIETETVRIGVLYSNPSAGYLSEFLIGLINEASAFGVQLVVEWVDQERGGASTDAFLSGGLNAVVIAPPLSDYAALIATVRGKGLPAVLVAPGQLDAQLSAVGVDHRGAAMRMTQHLISLGHERIGFITGAASHSAAGCRLAGFKDAMHAAGLETPEELIVPGAFTYTSGLTAAESLLRRPQRPTAVFASNDDMAAATMAVAHQLGIDVPADLTVVGCDDTPIAATSCPQLTTTRQPIRLMAATAVNLLVRQLKAQREGVDFPSEVVNMDCELIRRQSDAAPRKRSSAAAARRVGSLIRN